jgi:hypothetical protein
MIHFNPVQLAPKEPRWRSPRTWLPLASLAVPLGGLWSNHIVSECLSIGAAVAIVGLYLWLTRTG